MHRAKWSLHKMAYFSAEKQTRNLSGSWFWEVLISKLVCSVSLCWKLIIKMTGMLLLSSKHLTFSCLQRMGVQQKEKKDYCREITQLAGCTRRFSTWRYFFDTMAIFGSHQCKSIFSRGKDKKLMTSSNFCVFWTRMMHTFDIVSKINISSV